MAYTYEVQDIGLQQEFQEEVNLSAHFNQFLKRLAQESHLNGTMDFLLDMEKNDLHMVFQK